MVSYNSYLSIQDILMLYGSKLWFPTIRTFQSRTFQYNSYLVLAPLRGHNVHISATRPLPQILPMVKYTCNNVVEQPLSRPYCGIFVLGFFFQAYYSVRVRPRLNSNNVKFACVNTDSIAFESDFGWY